MAVPSASTAGPPKAPGEGAEADPRAGAGRPSLRDFHALLAKFDKRMRNGQGEVPVAKSVKTTRRAGAFCGRE